MVRSALIVHRRVLGIHNLRDGLRRSVWGLLAQRRRPTARYGRALTQALGDVSERAHEGGVGANAGKVHGLAELGRHLGWEAVYETADAGDDTATGFDSGAEFGLSLLNPLGLEIGPHVVWCFEGLAVGLGVEVHEALCAFLGKVELFEDLGGGLAPRGVELVAFGKFEVGVLLWGAQSWRGLCAAVEQRSLS